MYKVEGNKITMTRGDTLILQVNISQGEEPYVPVEGDSVRFAVKSRLNSRGTAFKEAEPLINKNIPTDTMLLTLEPDDTKQLPFGEYAYDIEITFNNGVVDTFITNSPLILEPEVH